MIIKKMSKRILVCLIIFMAITINSYARYYKKISIRYQSNLAEPIVKVEEISNKILDNNYNRNTGQLEYMFCIKNYEIDESGSKRISDVDFNYEMLIDESNHSFPIKYELYDMDSGEQLLKDNMKTDPKHIYRNKEYVKNYMLVASWDSNKELIGNIDITNIKIKVTQSMKGELL